jgi:hypothetical protein
MNPRHIPQSSASGGWTKETPRGKPAGQGNI